MKDLKSAIKQNNREAIHALFIWWGIGFLITLLTIIGTTFAIYNGIKIMA